MDKGSGYSSLNNRRSSATRYRAVQRRSLIPVPSDENLAISVAKQSFNKIEQDRENGKASLVSVCMWTWLIKYQVKCCSAELLAHTLIDVAQRR